MSYRTYINDTQIFGNNEYYPEWINFIKSQGIPVSEEFIYEGDLHDFMAALMVTESIVTRLNKERNEKNQRLISHGHNPEKSIFDFSEIPENLSKYNTGDRFDTALFDELLDTVHQGYAFLPYQLYRACINILQVDTPFAVPGHLHCFKLKPNAVIHIKAN